MKQEIERIKNKILNFDFDFDALDKAYIDMFFSDFCDILFESLNKRVVDLSEDTFFYLREKPSQNFSGKRNALISLALAEIKYKNTWKNDRRFFRKYMSYLDPETKQIIMNEVEKKRNVENEIDELFIDEEKVSYVRQLLAEKKYDEIFNLDNSYAKREVNALLFKEQFPFEELGIPSICNPYIELFEKLYEKMTVQQLILLWNKTFINESYSSVSYNKCKMVLKLLLDRDNFFEIFEYVDNVSEFIHSLELFANYYNHFIYDDIEKDSSYRSLLKFDKKLINAYVCYFDINELFALLDKDEKYYDVLEYIINFYNIEPVVYNDSLINSLIEHKKYELLALLLNKYKFVFGNIDEFFEKAIKSKDAGVIEFFKDITNNVSFQPNYNTSTYRVVNKREIFKRYYTLLLENDIFDLFNAIKILTDVVFGDSSLLDKISNYMIEHPDAKVELVGNSGYITSNPNFVKGLLIHKKYDDFLNHVRILPENMPIILDELDKSPLFRYVIVTESSSIRKRDEIFYKIISHNDLSALEMLKVLNHNEDYSRFYNKRTYDSLRVLLAEHYDLDIDKLDYIASHCGYNVIRFLENENLMKLMAMSYEELDKLVALVPDVEFTWIDLEAAYDSIKQYEYGIKNSDVINVFANILHSIEDGTDDYLKYLGEVASYLDDNFFERLMSKYNFDGNYRNNGLIFLKVIIERIKLNDELKSKYIDILHEITDYYILKKREVYRDSYNVYEDLDVPFVMDRKSQFNYLINYLLTNDFSLDIPSVFDMDYISLPEYMLLYFKDSEYDLSVIEDVLNYLKDPNCELKNDKKIVLQHIKIVKDAARNILYDDLYLVIDYNPDLEDVCDIAARSGYINKEYVIKQKEFGYLEFLLQLRLDLIEEKILNGDSNMYDSLVNCMKKRKLHVIPDVLINYLKSGKSLLNYSFSDLNGFIEYYYKIYEKERRILKAIGKDTDDILLSLPKALINMSVYSSLSSLYSLVLGEEDAKLIAANDGPNAATSKTSNNRRLDEALEWTIKNFKRDEITVPPINEVLEHNDKKMRCVVGNFTHPSNLTHGERTGACMRIGGVGDSLFNFILENKNGFHIRFEDPETGGYISRVSGFRNGNTVFLNELRCSCNAQKYSDEDVVEFCRMISQEMIDLSKDSECPIENVVVHRAYATQFVSDEEVRLGVSDIQEGLPNFYTDVSSYALIMATSNDDNSLVPVNFDKSKVPTYKPVREKIKVSDNLFDLYSMINRVHAINTYFEYDSFDEVDSLELDDDFVFGMANQDWYVYVDANNEIHEEIINIDKRAVIEFENAKENIMKYMREYSNNGCSLKI